MPFEQLSCQQLKQWLDEDKSLHLVDTRDPQSFQQGHIEGARRLDNSNVEQFLTTADRNQPVVVCCYHGNSSQSAADFFNQQGFENSYSLIGGYEAWKLQN